MAESLVVLFPATRPTTNPYLVMLGDAIRTVPNVQTLDFSWRSALLGKYDVAHLHWPEALLKGRSAWRSAAKRALFGLFLLRIQLCRRPLVRTLHNVDLPNGLSRGERSLLMRAERQTTLWIILNEFTHVADGAAVELIPHGHYRDWFDRYPKATPIPGRLAYFGLIRRYKAVDQLVAVFRQVRGGAVPAMTLTVSGSPSSMELADDLVRLADSDPRIEFSFKFLQDEEIVGAVTAAELVVLPYRHMHNSGGALAALSLDRPVLVPDNEVNRSLGAEVGAGWVHTYSPGLTPETLVSALEAVRRTGARGRPDLSRRAWDRAGQRYVAAYKRACELIRE